jgi:hypothetical protein
MERFDEILSPLDTLDFFFSNSGQCARCGGEVKERFPHDLSPDGPVCVECGEFLQDVARLIDGEYDEPMCPVRYCRECGGIPKIEPITAKVMIFPGLNDNPLEAA